MPMGRGNFGHGRMPVQKAKDFKGTLRRLMKYFRPHRFRLMVVVLTTILSTVFSIVSPDLMGKATTLLFKGVMARDLKFAPIVHILVVLAVLYVLSSAFSYVQQYVMAGVAQKTVYALRREANQKLARLPLKFFDARPNGEILSRFVNDFDNISNTLQQSLTQLIGSVITFVGVIVMMLTISPLMTLVVALTLPLSLLVTRMVAKRSQKNFKAQQKSLGQLNSHVEEMYTGHKIVKAFGHEERSIAKFEEINRQLYESGWRSQFVSGLIMPLMNFIGNLGYLFVSVIGGILVMRRAIQIGDIQAFIQYTRQFSQPLTQLSSIANIIQSTIASAERVFELLDEMEEVEEPLDAKVIDQPKGDVAFHDVKFGYRSDALLIEDMNIDVLSGQTVAIVGPTGAGKTTLVNLLMRFYEVNGGKITIDGRDIAHLKRDNLRSLFGMVLQDTWLFHGTIYENIAYGRADATEEDVVQAAKSAHADRFIRTLPDGYQTILNEEASNLSQGQKQLLTIARAILKDPAILILDEATSSVDTRTEVLIQNAMKELMKGRTSFVIAHRLSTIRDADLILVMDRGTVVEQGTHSALLERGGFYAELYNSQFAAGAVTNSVG
ncbi:ABC transporter ATP-binding protein/permease [Alicyclobacillus fastidiosus]|uniref:ABC transporter ATP-binding protein/permease n=2 Tax=Alicyclobacillus fastidiosus TaxID=392011 RepID=A0ABY6ZRC6_9BACL|nr:ABC transporter ATP-binding protein [Alicyclobacillus fastidiosus]WAH44654.1 ABC transporter ATP-binding protein/permease [Alicyclobacillus fastidiosus]